MDTMYMDISGKAMYIGVSGSNPDPPNFYEEYVSPCNISMNLVRNLCPR